MTTPLRRYAATPTSCPYGKASELSYASRKAIGTPDPVPRHFRQLKTRAPAGQIRQRKHVETGDQHQCERRPHQAAGLMHILVVIIFGARRGIWKPLRFSWHSQPLFASDPLTEELDRRFRSSSESNALEVGRKISGLPNGRDTVCPSFPRR